MWVGGWAGVWNWRDGRACDMMCTLKASCLHTWHNAWLSGWPSNSCPPAYPPIPAGVRPSNLRDAAAFQEVQAQVAELLKGRILVGHAIENDLEVRTVQG